MTTVFFKPLLLNFSQVTLFVTGIYSITACDSYVSEVNGRSLDRSDVRGSTCNRRAENFYHYIYNGSNFCFPKQ